MKDYGINTFDADLAADWSGQFADGKVSGRLTLDHLTGKGLPTVGDVAAKGSVDVTADGLVVTARPGSLTLTTDYAPLSEVRVAGGAVVYDAKGAHVNGVSGFGSGRGVGWSTRCSTPPR